MGRSTGRARAGHSRRACWGSFGLREALSVVLLMTWNYSASLAEDATKVVRIGVLASAQEHPIQSFRERLRELGWIEGKNVQFDYRWAEADDTRQPGLAAELVALPVDLILTWGTAAGLARKGRLQRYPLSWARSRTRSPRASFPIWRVLAGT